MQKPGGWFLTLEGMYKFVHPVDYVVHDPYEHVGWFFALQTPCLVGSVLTGCNDYYKSLAFVWPSKWINDMDEER